MICKPTENTYSRKHFLLIAGIPGIGKSTLALSAPAPLFIDCDQSLYKVNPVHRICDYINPQTYMEIREDLKSDLSAYQSLIFDTGGELISFMKLWATKQNTKYVQRDGTTLTMSGYGAVKREFESLVDYCLNELHKHVIMVCHVSEMMENDITVFKLDVEGSSNRYMWKKADLGAFMSIQGQKRILEFSPTDTHHAKGAYGISGIREYSYPKAGSDNVFIKELFQEADIFMAQESELLKKYNEIMDMVNDLVNSTIDQTSVNEAMETFSGIEWIFSARREAWTILSQKAAALGLKYDPVTKHFIPTV